MNRINLIILLDKLEDMIDQAPEIPLTGRILLDADVLLELIDKIRNSVPEEVKRAEMMSTEKERFLSEGQQRADQIVAQAKEQAARLLKESEIYQQAQKEAKLILTEANERAKQLELGSAEYAKSILNELENHLNKTLTSVNKGQEELSRQKSEL